MQRSTQTSSGIERNRASVARATAYARARNGRRRASGSNMIEAVAGTAPPGSAAPAAAARPSRSGPRLHTARGGEDSQAEPENGGERRADDGDGERPDRRARGDAEESRREIRRKEAADECCDGAQVRGIEERRRLQPRPHPAEDERSADRAAEGQALHPTPPPYSSLSRTEGTSPAGRSKSTRPPPRPPLRRDRSRA